MFNTNSVESLIKVKVNNTHCFLHLHKSNHFITESNQVSEVLIPLAKSMLTVPNHYLLHGPRWGFQEDLIIPIEA